MYTEGVTKVAAVAAALQAEILGLKTERGVTTAQLLVNERKFRLHVQEGDMELSRVGSADRERVSGISLEEALSRLFEETWEEKARAHAASRSWQELWQAAASVDAERAEKVRVCRESGQMATSAAKRAAARIIFRPRPN